MIDIEITMANAERVIQYRKLEPEGDLSGKDLQVKQGRIEFKNI